LLQNRLLTDEKAHLLWIVFAAKVGIKALRESYGVYWPRKPLEGEIAYEWRNDDQLIGWSAIRRDVLEPVFWINIGVFPNEQGKGYSSKIFWATIKIGFETFEDVEWCFSAISRKNSKPFSYTKRDTEWVYVGETVIPEPGYTVFGLSRLVYRVKGESNV
jgi:hypothetical protein